MSNTGARALAGVLWVCVAVSAAADDPNQANYAVVARVNDEPITFLDVSIEVEPEFRAWDRDYSLTPRQRNENKQTLWTATLRGLVEQALALQVADRMGIRVDEAEVDSEYRSFVQQIGGREHALRYADERGITLDELRSTIQDKLTVTSLVKQKLGLGARSDQGGSRHQDYDLYIKPAELRRYFDAHQKSEFVEEEGVKVRLIKLPWDPAAERRAAQRRLAGSLIGLVAKGASFAALARELSAPPFRDAGGCLLVNRDGQRRWDFASRVELDAEEEGLGRFAFSLRPGVVPPVFEGTHAAFIVQVEARREHREIPFDEAQILIRKRLHKERLDENLKHLREELRATARIEPPTLFERVHWCPRCQGRPQPDREHVCQPVR